MAGADEGSGEAAIAVFEADGEADEVDFAGGDVSEIEAFDDGDAVSEEGVVDGLDVAFEATDGEVVNADEGDAGFAEEAGSGFGEVDEVFLKRGFFEETVARVLRFKEEAVAGLWIGGSDFFGGNLVGILGLDDPGGADEVVERDGIDAGGVFHEVVVAIHVGAGVGADGELGDGADIPVREADYPLGFQHGVVRPGGHAGAEWDGDILPGFGIAHTRDTYGLRGAELILRRGGFYEPVFG